MAALCSLNECWLSILLCFGSYPAFGKSSPRKSGKAVKLHHTASSLQQWTYVLLMYVYDKIMKWGQKVIFTDCAWMHSTYISLQKEVSCGMLTSSFACNRHYPQYGANTAVCSAPAKTSTACTLMCLCISLMQNNYTSMQSAWVKWVIAGRHFSHSLNESSHLYVWGWGVQKETILTYRHKPAPQEL